MSTNVKNSDHIAPKRGRFRFSIGSLLTLVFVIAAMFGYMQFKLRLVDSTDWMERLYSVAEFIPIDTFLLFLLTQIAYFVLVIAILVVHHRPRLLWLCVAGHIVWSLAVVLAFLAGVSINTWVGDSIFIVVFYEPSFTFVVTSVTVIVAGLRLRFSEKLLLAVVFFLALLGELVATLALNEFVAALMAALSM